MYLVKVGGSLYGPVKECEEGCIHYDYFDSPSIKVPVDEHKSARDHILWLLKELKDSFDDEGLVSDRINLLYGGKRRCGKGGDKLDLNITDLLYSKAFDLFVYDNAQREHIRFQYVDGELYRDGVLIDSEAKLHDVFGEVVKLELTHLSYPEAVFLPGMDPHGGYDVVSMWASDEDGKKREDLIEKLSEHGISVFEKLSLIDLYCMFLAASEDSVCSDYIVNFIRNEDYRCECYFSSGQAEEDVESRLDILEDKEMMIESGGFYMIPFRTIRQKHVKTLGGYISGLYPEDLEDDQIAVLLSLVENETMIIDEIPWETKNMGINITADQLNGVLDGLAENGYIIKECDMFGINPRFLSQDDSNQKKLPFEPDA